MVKSFLLVFLTIFSVAGICEFVYIVKMLFYSPNIRVQNYSLIVLKKGYALRQLNYIWQKIKWHGDEFAVGIIAVTDGVESEELFDCDNFVKGKNIILCTAASVSECVRLQGS